MSAIYLRAFVNKQFTNKRPHAVGLPDADKNNVHSNSIIY